MVNSTTQLDIEKLGGLTNLRQPSTNILVSGQPGKAHLQALSDAGIKHIVNLRPDQEMSWDEQSLVESLGMTYHTLPITGATDVTFSNALKLDQLLNQLQGEKILIHCASGNRVGALRALSVAYKGSVEQQAIDEGKLWGMTRLELHVKTLISEHIQICCIADEHKSTQ